jgi:hypothetical protein
MQFELPNMLKQRPRQFWGMLKSKAMNDTAMPTVDFVKHNESIFYDSTIAPDEFTPLSERGPQYITRMELQSVINLNFKTDKSSGLS